MLAKATVHVRAAQAADTIEVNRSREIFTAPAALRGTADHDSIVAAKVHGGTARLLANAGHYAASSRLVVRVLDLGDAVVDDAVETVTAGEAARERAVRVDGIGPSNWLIAQRAPNVICIYARNIALAVEGHIVKL